MNDDSDFEFSKYPITISQMRFKKKTYQRGKHWKDQGARSDNQIWQSLGMNDQVIEYVMTPSTNNLNVFELLGWTNVLDSVIAGLGVSNIDIDINTINDTFAVSISMILLRRSIESSIDDTLTAVFVDTLISILFAAFI
jgi:hypothetical protein